ncbi:MAG TPA: glycosyltransferase [Methanocella sp.]|nr:glycosyltransferase [Methanocella sp.]
MNVAIIYDRLNYLTLGSVIALVKSHVDRVYVYDGPDPRIAYVARSLGATLIGPSGPGKGFELNHIVVNYSDGAYVFLYGDGTHHPDRVPLLLEQLENGFDVAVSPVSAGVDENVLFLNNKSSKAGFSGFMACSTKCFDGHLRDGMSGLAKQVFSSARGRGLRVKELDPLDEKADTLSLYRIGVVVPSYNEESLVGQTIAGIPPYVNKIYVVDDCSSDRTPGVVKNIADPRVVYIRHEVNKGVGAAIVTGYRRALEDEMDVAAVMAGDNQMDPGELPRLLMPVLEGKADYAKGNRLITRNLRKGMSAWRTLGNFLLTIITKIGSGYWHVTDPQNGYTAISRRALGALDLDSVYTYYGYCNDLLIKLNAFGMRTVDVVMPARYGGERSKIKYSRFILKVAPMIFRGFLWRLKTKYVLFDFNPLVLFYGSGMVLVPAGAALGAWMLWQVLAGHPVSSGYPLFTVFTILWGAQFILIAMVLDMQENKARIMA